MVVGSTWGGLLPGCARHQEKPTITAVGLSPGNRCDPPAIPYYLPKPLLVISKNFRHIDESKVQRFLDHFRRDRPQIQSERGDRSLTLEPAGS